MKSGLVIFVMSGGAFIGSQMVIPFPYGLAIGIFVPAIMLWYYYKKRNNSDSLVNKKRMDAVTKKEKEQNLEAYRRIKARYINGEITKEGFEKLKKPFDDTIDNQD